MSALKGVCPPSWTATSWPFTHTLGAVVHGAAVQEQPLLGTPPRVLEVAPVPDHRVEAGVADAAGRATPEGTAP